MISADSTAVLPAVMGLLHRTVPVSLLLVLSVCTLFACEALAILVLARFRAGISIHERLVLAATYCVHPLTGTDERLSWSKIITLAVLVAYWTRGAVVMPQGVAYAIIAASHGTKVLLALIGNMKVNVDAKEAVSFTETVVKHVMETRHAETGEPLPGAPGQPLPAVAPAE